MLSTLALMLPLAFAAQDGAEAKAAATTQKPLPSAKASEAKAIEEIDVFLKGLEGSGKLDKSKNRWRNSMSMPPTLTFSPKLDYFWNLRTNKGDVKIRLMPDIAPVHASSTIALVRSGFYDDLKFHRVIKGFMAQGGCPDGNGRGGPGYKYSGETKPNVKHDRPGLLSMANTGRPQTDGSQFFLTFVPTPWLDGKHTIFGEVVDGMEVLKVLESLGSQNGATKELLKMEKSTITVAEKKKKAAKPETKPAR